MVGTLPAIVSTTEPAMNIRAVARIAGKRPRLEANGPELRAPTRPPTVNAAEMKAKAASLMGMQVGIQPDPSSAGVLPARRARSAKDDIAFLWQVMTS
jgi:hypothetical protein